MAKSRKLSSNTTSIGKVPWSFKDEISKYKRVDPTRKDQNESDIKVIGRFFEVYKKVLAIRPINITIKEFNEWLEDVKPLLSSPSKEPKSTFRWETVKRKGSF